MLIVADRFVAFSDSGFNNVGHDGGGGYVKAAGHERKWYDLRILRVTLPGPKAKKVISQEKTGTLTLPRKHSGQRPG